jgi:hypothetical protein
MARDTASGSSHCVAVQVAFERHILKPGYHLIGNHLKPDAFKLWVKCIQLALPHHCTQCVALGCVTSGRASGAVCAGGIAIVSSRYRSPLPHCSGTS